MLPYSYFHEQRVTDRLLDCEREKAEVIVQLSASQRDLRESEKKCRQATADLIRVQARLAQEHDLHSQLEKQVDLMCIFYFLFYKICLKERKKKRSFKLS